MDLGSVPIRTSDLTLWQPLSLSPPTSYRLPQGSDQNVSVRSDLFALELRMCKLMAGLRPYEVDPSGRPKSPGNHHRVKAGEEHPAPCMEDLCNCAGISRIFRRLSTHSYKFIPTVGHATSPCKRLTQRAQSGTFFWWRKKLSFQVPDRPWKKDK